MKFEVDYFGCDEGHMDKTIAMVALDFLTDAYKAPEQIAQAEDYLRRYLEAL